MNLRSVFRGLAPLLLSLGCSSTPASPQDAAVASDLGPQDAAVATNDAAKPSDHTAVDDAPQASDAATPTDTVTAQDVAAPTDQPAPDDAAMAPDAAPPSDAAMAPDAAPADGGVPDWRFRPMPHGFNFANYGNTIISGDMMRPAANLTGAEMRRVFGPRVCEGNTTTGTCVLVPQARQWMEQRNAEMDNGHCEGMAVLASNFYSGFQSPMDFGTSSAFALPLFGNEALQREVAVWFITQYTVPGLERANLTPRQVVAELERDLARGSSYRGTVLGVYVPQPNGGKGNGHAVSPYAVRRPEPGRAEILSYDNNFPNEERVVAVDLNADTFIYRTSTNPMVMSQEYTGTATTFTLTLIDIAPRLTFPQNCPFCGDLPMPGAMQRGSVQIALRGEGDVGISDAMGRTVGVNAMGMQTNTLPGAQSTRVRSNFRDSPEPVYTVPREGTLTLTLDGSRLQSSTPTDLQITGQGFSLGVEGITLDPMQRDTLTYRTDTPDLAYRASGAETPRLVLAFQTSDADYLLEVRASAVTSGQTLRLSVDPVTQRVRVSFDGSTSAPTFELYMERVSEAGVVSFDHAGVASSAASVLSFAYGMWGGNGMPLRMEVDTDGNGSVDRTENLSDDN
ncbi:MAG: hypothetical protein U0325_00910 [Polyangiales bacterium]